MRLAVTGYASLDHVLTLDGPVVADQTTRAHHHPSAWPRAGGCPSYISRAVAHAGQSATPVMWVGGDPAGQTLIDALERDGVGTDAIARINAATSPAAVLAYQPDGRCACLFDPGPKGQEALTEAQKAAISAASHLCISVGPPQLLADILALRDPEMRLYWAVKSDPESFPPDIRRQLSRHADVIFCSAPERDFVGDTGAIVLETRGMSGVHVQSGQGAETLPVNRIDLRDTTGAGDTFAGGYIAAEMRGTRAPADAARAGIDAAARMLTNRQRKAQQ